MINLPQPQGLEFMTWGSLVAEQLANFGVSSPTSEAEWKEWACSLLGAPELAALPTPGDFETWDRWAERASEATI